MFVLGIDPGLSRCGYCCLDTDGRTHRTVALGVLTTPPSAPVPERLAELAGDIRALFDELRPQAVAVERVLFQVNVRTAISVGQASGLVLAEAAGRGCDVVEYSPNQVKGAVAGHGSADKDEVATMVQWPVSYTHLRAHETVLELVCRLLLEKKTKVNLLTANHYYGT